MHVYNSAKSGLVEMKSLGYQLLGFTDILGIFYVGPLNIEKLFMDNIWKFSVCMIGGYILIGVLSWHKLSLLAEALNDNPINSRIHLYSLVMVYSPSL